LQFESFQTSRPEVTARCPLVEITGLD
jgi:hypothetical protein